MQEAETMTDADYAVDLVPLSNTLPKPNPFCIVWSKQQKALASVWTQIEQSSCVLNPDVAISTLISKPLRLAEPFT